MLIANKYDVPDEYREDWAKGWINFFESGKILQSNL